MFVCIVVYLIKVYSEFLIVNMKVDLIHILSEFECVEEIGRLFRRTFCNECEGEKYSV